MKFFGVYYDQANKIISHFLSDLGQNGDRVSEKDRKRSIFALS